MKLTDFHIFTYHLPLNNPLQIGTYTLSKREGAIIRIRTDTGQYGFGEAAPLNGLHRENLSDTLDQLKIIQHHLTNVSLESIPGVIDLLQKANAWFPTVQFALESAYIDLIEAANLEQKMDVLPNAVQDNIMINSLLTGSYEFIKNKVDENLEKNYRSIKIKIGRQTLEEEIDLIKYIQKRVEKNTTLRLDANRNWTYEQAKTFASSIDKKSIEYIEEPLNTPERLSELAHETEMPIALDESLIEIPANFLKNNDWIRAIIIKPSVLGSLENTLGLISQAEQNGIKVVISDTFHSGIGLSFLIRLASTIKEPIAMGFDTYQWLDDDVLVNRLPIENGCFDFKTVMDYCKNVDYSKLERVG
jgi:O-succinylbenzoate synthase